MPVLLVLTPHPDDEAYTVGGLLTLASRAGWRCVVACATRGERGERFDAGSLQAAEALAAVRERELHAACAVVGAHVEVWGLPDGDLAGLERDVRHLCGDAIGRHRPDVVVTMGPDGVYGHPDHLALHRAATAAWRLLPASRLCPLLYFAFPEALFVPQAERCIAAGVVSASEAPAPGVRAPHYRLGVEGVADEKLAAIRSHRSQLPGGDPFALFPAGIIQFSVSEEWFLDADGAADPAVSSLLDDFVMRSAAGGKPTGA